VAGRVNPIRYIGRSVQKKQRRHNYHDHLDNSIIFGGNALSSERTSPSFYKYDWYDDHALFTYRRDCWNPR